MAPELVATFIDEFNAGIASLLAGDAEAEGAAAQRALGWTPTARSPASSRQSRTGLTVPL